MSVLLTLALPVAGSCADAPKTPDNKDAVAGAATKAPDNKDAIVDAATKAMSKSGHMMGMMGGSQPTDPAAVNPSGKVIETMNGGGYTYANLEKDGKQTWVAFPTLETRVGDTLSFRGCMQMNKFQSKSLNRTFDAILFCGAPDVKPTTIKSNPIEAKQSPGSEGAASTASEKIKVEKATGANAYTVAELFAKRTALNGKQVVVKGQVVKISTGIMNKNWIHLQDGTGDAKKKTHDLVLTTGDSAEVGDVVTVSGTLAKDKDFGGGYKYNVIVEKASLKK